MKIAVTITDCVQVGVDSFRDRSVTGIFDSSQSIDEMMEWAKRHMKDAKFCDLKFSEVQP